MNTQTIIIGGVVAVGVYLFFKDELQGAVDKINPANPDNIFAQGGNTLADVLDDGIKNDSNSLGTLIFEWIHGENG